MLPKLIVGTVDITTRRGDCPAFGRECHKCGRKTTLAKCVSESKRDSRKPRQATGRCTHKCRVHEVNEECQNDMENLTDQVQSLFYSIETKGYGWPVEPWAKWPREPDSIVIC